MSIFAELKRRNVFRVGIAYVVLGWVVIQVTDTLAPALRLPDWTLSFVALIGLIGFPFALLFAWAFELTPEGIKREEEIDRSESITRSTGRKLDFAIIGLLLVSLGFVVWDAYLKPSETDSTDSASPRAADASAQAGPDTIETVSIAVLPLTNMSAIADNVYFAGGVHEEILTNLAAIESLHVVSRTTAMRYIDTELSIPDIGRELDVRYVVEGSVRRVNDHVRVTVQLIEAAQDKHLWASNYDRELLDVFATQSAVAREISNSLHLTIQPETVSALSDTPTQSVRAYDLYTKAKSIDRSEPESESALLRQAELLEAAVVEDPDFVDAWGFLSEVYDDSHRTITESGWFIQEGEDRQAVEKRFFDKSLRALKKAYALDPENEETLIARAANHVGENYLFPVTIDEHEAQRKAVMDITVEKYPQSARAWIMLGWWYVQNWDPEKAESAFRKAIEVDPLNVGAVVAVLGYYREVSGDQAMTTQLTERLNQIVPTYGDDDAFWGKASMRRRVWPILDAFQETADESLINKYIAVLGEDGAKYLSQYEQGGLGAFALELQNDLEGMLTQSNDLVLPTNATFGEVADHVDYLVVLLSAQRIAGAETSMLETARRILQAEKLPAFHATLTQSWNHVAQAMAHAALGDLDSAGRMADQLVSGRNQYYNAYGIPGFIALAQVDMDRAVALILEEKKNNPTWSGTDNLAVAHWMSRDILVHPQMQAYYVKEGKWIDYLSARVPEYASYRNR